MAKKAKQKSQPRRPMSKTMYTMKPNGRTSRLPRTRNWSRTQTRWSRSYGGNATPTSTRNSSGAEKISKLTRSKSMRRQFTFRRKFSRERSSKICGSRPRSGRRMAPRSLTFSTTSTACRKVGRRMRQRATITTRVIGRTG